MSDHQEAVDNMEGHGHVMPPGERLRRAREKSELSIEQVASHLKLNAVKISALERGEVDQLAAPVFVAGYLRAYARLVDLPEEEVIADFKALSTMKAPSMDPSSSPAANNYGEMESVSNRKGIKSRGGDWSQIAIWGSVVVVLLVVVFVFLSGDEAETITSKGDKTAVSEMKSSIMEGAPADQGQLPDDRSMQTDTANNTEGFAQEAEPESTAKEIEIAKDVMSTGETIKNSLSEGQGSKNLNHSVIVFNFRDDSWISVTDAKDKRLLFRIGKAGTSKTVWGLAPFRVHLGYVAGVDIIFNGKPYDLSSYADRRSAKFRLGKSGDHMSTN